MTSPVHESRHRSTARLTDLTYWEAAQHPTYVILFLMPLVLVQVILRWGAVGDGSAVRALVVEDFLQQVTRIVGFDVAWMPAAIVVLTLLIWLSRTPQRVPSRWTYLPLMFVESLLVALPLLVIGLLLSIEANSFGYRVTHALTAGIYEEFVFRFVLTGGLILLFRAAIPRAETTVVVAAILVSAMLFAACHFQPIGQRVYDSWAFTRLVIAGAYLGLVFVGRGLGIAVGAHIAYDYWVLSTRDAHF